MSIALKLDPKSAANARKALAAAQSKAAKAMRNAGDKAGRWVTTAAVKSVQQDRALKSTQVRSAVKLIRPTLGTDYAAMRWQVKVTGKGIALVGYPYTFDQLNAAHVRQGGVSVQVRKGKTTVIPKAFVARMRSGHVGIFVRKQGGRGIRELYSPTVAHSVRKVATQLQRAAGDMLAVLFRDNLAKALK